jgi:TPR repeat protein
MASREFLKILQSARLGDVSAQQNLASAYLTGAFKTPIQPANALLWLEKSFFTIQNQSLSSVNFFESLNFSELLQSTEIVGVLEKIVLVPLSLTFKSPGFSFGWGVFWKLAELDIPASSNAQWQLAELLLHPAKQDLQKELAIWLSKEKIWGEFPALQKTAKQYLFNLSESETLFTQQAKELQLLLEPKNETLTSLWNEWLTKKDEGALIRAAENGLTVAKLTLGLRLAQLEEDALSEKNVSSKTNASLKKAAYWLELAGKDGDRDAWFALGSIYRKPQFSGYNAIESDRCFDKAADLGHAQAQFRKGANLWRKREKITEPIRGLQASYWVWQAHQQGVIEATELLGKILENVANAKQNEWHELATFADKALNHAEHKLDLEWLLMCHRLIVANQFNLSKAELLLCEISQLQHEHCVVVDIRFELPKILPRLIQIETTQQRRYLLAAGKAFSGIEAGLEGNLRQRRYRFDRVTEWLVTTFSKIPLKAQAA